MQTPSAADPSFKAFLEKLQEQNSRGFVIQLIQLKAEREIAGEDNDKREDQLDEVIKSLNDLRTAVTGIDIEINIEPLVDIGKNQTRLLEELSREASLTRKLTEGSVEYDKEAAQYRNTSGRDIESKVSGKISKSGGFIDFETARDTLSGQGKRVREDNAFDLKPINYTPGKIVASAVKGDGIPASKIVKEKEEELDRSLLGRIKDSAKFFMTDGLSEKNSKEVVKKERETKVSSPRQENPEADNITSTGEIQADAAKSDLELSKQMLDTTKAQLVELKAIREALAPKTPKELIKKGPKDTGTPSGNEEGGGGGSILGDLASGAMDLMGGKGKLGKMGRGLMTAGRAALPYAAAAGVAVAGGAAVDYGLGKLGVGKDKEGNDLQVDTAQDDANWAKMSMGQKIESGFARGIEKTGSALFLGNVSKEAQATRIKKETDYLNKNTPGAATKEALVGSGELGNKAEKARLVAKEQYQSGNKEEEAAKQKLKEFEKDNPFDYRDKPTRTQTFLELPGDGKFSNPEKQKEYNALLDAKREAFSKQSKAREDYEKTDNAQKYKVNKDGRETENIGADFKKKDVLLGRFGYKDADFLNEDGQSYSMGKINQAYDTKVKEDLLSPLQSKESKPTEGNSLEAKKGAIVAPGKATAVAPMETVDGTSRRGNSGFSSMTQTNPDGTPYTLDQITAAKAEQRAGNAGVYAADNSKVKTGSDVSKTSTENNDMEREASSKGGANNTVVSNNVSSNNTTKIVPMKASPRPEYTGSSLDRYTNRITVY